MNGLSLVAEEVVENGTSIFSCVSKPFKNSSMGDLGIYQ